MLANQHNPTITIERIYDEHAASMYGCIYKLVQKKEVADKILNEVFIEIFTKKTASTFTINNSAWFLKQAMNAAFHFIKQGPMANELPLKVQQQILEIKTVKHLLAKNS